jgi:hypothetical protein
MYDGWKAGKMDMALERMMVQKCDLTQTTLDFSANDALSCR